MAKLFLAAYLLIVGAGCANTAKEDDEYLLRPAKVNFYEDQTQQQRNKPNSALQGASNDLRNSVRYTQLSQNIRFDYASADLTPETKKALDTMASEINSSLGSFNKIRVSGITDASGDDSRNMRLSEQRAENVRRYLISKGVPPDKIEAIGMGAAKSSLDGTKMKAAADRRVDFEIVR
ncbi:MAG: OmpA family protein [Bdellovibrio sp.]|nr:OmpA family protein [Bdellovibrio sp.]